MIQQMLDQQLGAYEDQIEQLRQENQELKQRVMIYSDGNQISRADYNSLEDKYREQQDIIARLKRENSDLESKCATITTKCQTLEMQIQRQNNDMTNGVVETKNKDSQITILKSQIEKLNQTISNQKNNLQVILDEKRSVTNTLREMSAKNTELQTAVEAFLERDKALVQALQEQSALVADRDAEIANLQRRVVRSETKLKKYDKNAVTDEPLKIPPKKDGSKGNAAAEGKEEDLSGDIQDQLLQAKKKNREYRQRIFKLQDEERKAQRLTQALESRQKQIINLQTLLDKTETELLQYKQSSEDFANQIAIYREEKELMRIESSEQVQELKKQVEELTIKYQEANKTRESLQTQMEEKNIEMADITNQVRAYENGEFGLPQAIDEMKELRAMVEVREKHIAELIDQVNSMDKIINGLTLELGTDFNYDEFIKSLDERMEQQEQLRIARAKRELEARVRQMRANPQLGPISIVVNEAERKDFDLRATVKAHLDAQPQPKKQKRKKKHEEVVQIFDSDLSDSTKSESSKKTENEPKKPETLLPEIRETVDAEVQAADVPLPPQFYEMNDDERDEWVANLQKKYLELQKQLKDLQQQLKNYADKILRMEADNQNKQEQINTLQAENEEYKARLRSAANEFMQAPPPQRNQEVIKIPVHEPKATLFMTPFPVEYSIPLKMLQMSVSNQTIGQFPTDEEKRIMEARERERSNKMSEALTTSANLQAQLDEYLKKLNQKDGIIHDNQETIENLRKQLKELAEHYKERLKEFKEESERNVEARLREMQDALAAGNGGAGNGPNYSALPEVARRLKELNNENDVLQKRINDLEEMLSGSNQLAEQYRQRIKALESEKENKDDIPVKGRQEGPLSHPYAQKLQRQNAELKKKIAYLNDQIDQLRSTRQRYEPIQTDHSASDTNRDQEQIERLTAQMKSYKAKYIQVKSQQDELLLRLEKEKETTERLKTMLQKRETVVQKLTDKNNQYKHQNEKLKAALIARGGRPSR